MDELKRKISNTDYNILINCNFTTLLSIIDCHRGRLASLTNLGLNTVDEIQLKAAEVILKNIRISSCKDRLSKSLYLSTGCSQIDTLTKNGLSVDNGIVEIVGSSGVGKTQFCLQLSIMVQLSINNGGLNRPCVYLYDNMFPSKRFQQLSENFQKKYPDFEGQFGDNLFLKKITDYDELKLCIFNQIPKLLRHKQFGLLIIDSIAGIFRYNDVETNYLERSQQFIEIVQKLHEISRRHQLIVVVINQVMDNPNSGNIEPCLGISWTSLITHRFSINRIDSLLSQIRKFEVVFAPDLPNKSCKFRITERGIE